MSNKHGSGQRRRGAAAGARAGKRAQRPQEHTQQQAADAPCAPPPPDAARPEVEGGGRAPQPDAFDALIDASSLGTAQARARQAQTPPEVRRLFADHLAALPATAASPRGLDAADGGDAGDAGAAAKAGTAAGAPAGGRPAGGPVELPRRVPGETLDAWDRTATAAPDANDPWLRAMREDLGEVLGLVAPPVHARTADTLVMPAVADGGAGPEGDAGAPPRPPVPARLTAPVPSGAPVGPAIPGRYRVEPPAVTAQVTASRTAAPVETTRPLPRIATPSVPPPTPVPVTPGLLRRIFGAPWLTVLELWRAEVVRFGAGRIAAIHHVPTDGGAAAMGAHYAFGCTPVVWDGERFVGGGPRDGRMHPAVAMLALVAHVRDQRACCAWWTSAQALATHTRDHHEPGPATRAAVRETAVQDAPQDAAAGQVVA